MADHLDLDAIRARAEAATEGPWHRVGKSIQADVPLSDDGPSTTKWNTTVVCSVGAWGSGRPTEEDAEFIAHARTDVPALLSIAQAALYREGSEDCLQNECDHVEGEGATCPMVDTRFATADDAVRADVLRSRIDDVRDLMARGISDADLREQIGRLLESWDGS